jgi:hypothetical protein
LGADGDTNESSLIYTWSIVGGTSPAPVTFSNNGTNAAKNTVATFHAAGTYSFQVTIADPEGLSVTSTVIVTVNQTLTTITLSPSSATLRPGTTQQFTATAKDQFGNAMAVQPAFSWTTTVGTISTDGLLTTPNTSATGKVTCKCGTVSAMASVTVTAPNHAPTVATAAAASATTVTGQTVTLRVSGADPDTGEGSLTYTWAATTLPAGAAAPKFSVNGTNAAKNATVTFSQAGTYVFTVKIADPGGASVTSQVTVVVNQAIKSLAVTPNAVTLNRGGKLQFTAKAYDQFGKVMAVQPALTWTATLGTITTGGLFTAPNASAFATITCRSGTISGTATVNITNRAPTVAAAAVASPSIVTAKTTVLSVVGADIDTGEGSLAYRWQVKTAPKGVPSPTFSANNSNAAKKTTVTFSQAGTYSFMVTITDPNGATVTSTVNVTVNQTLTSIALSQTAAILRTGSTLQFTATAKDQFGRAMAVQPTFTWSTTVGTITSRGLLKASNAAALSVVTCRSRTVAGTARVTVIKRLVAAEGHVAAASDASLTVAELTPIVQEAEARWAMQGLSAATIARLASVRAVLCDLPDDCLGAAQGETVYVDRTAAGHGWYVDPTPAQDEEYGLRRSPGESQTSDPRIASQYDLLTVVLHELGHVAGLEDVAVADRSLMSESLSTGIRRLPGAAEADTIFRQSQPWIGNDTRNVVGHRAADAVRSGVASVLTTTNVQSIESMASLDDELALSRQDQPMRTVDPRNVDRMLTVSEHEGETLAGLNGFDGLSDNLINSVLDARQSLAKL